MVVWRVLWVYLTVFCAGWQFSLSLTGINVNNAYRLLHNKLNCSNRLYVVPAKEFTNIPMGIIEAATSDLPGTVRGIAST
jgi:hypothetical protein